MTDKGALFGAGLHAEREACVNLSREEIERRYVELDEQCGELPLNEGDELRGRLLGCWFALQREV